ncbi:MAG: hypothetical protein ACLSE4_10275 [Clostridium sp.]
MVLVKSWNSRLFINTVLADFISLVAGPIQQKPVIPAFRGA